MVSSFVLPAGGVNTDAADDAVRFEMRRCAESDFGEEIFDDDGPGGVERVTGEGPGLGRDQRLPDTTLLPPFAGPDQQAPMLGLQLEDLAELDVQTAGDELGGGAEQVGLRHSGERLLAEVRDRFLLARCSAQLLFGAVRFLDA